MASSKLYNPSDINSSPFEPMIGSLVLYRPERNSSAESRRLWPAIITDVCNTSDDRVNLTIFTSHGVVYCSRVPFSGDPTRDNTWQWMKEPTRREVQIVKKDNKEGDSREHQAANGGGQVSSISGGDSSAPSEKGAGKVASGVV